MIENSFSLSSTKYFIEDMKSAVVLINVNVHSLHHIMIDMNYHQWCVYLQVSDTSIRTKTVSSMKNSSVVDAHQLTWEQTKLKQLV